MNQPYNPDDFPFHPLANIFPIMSADEFSGLVSDIRSQGQQYPCELIDGKVIDGRNRWAACAALGIKPQTVNIHPSGSLIDYVESRNVHRRSLTTDQRAIVVARLAKEREAEAEAALKEKQRQSASKTHGKLGRGANADETATPKGFSDQSYTKDGVSQSATDHLAPKTSGEILRQEAERHGVSIAKAERALRVVKDDPAAADAVASGTVTLNSAHSAIKAAQAAKTTPKANDDLTPDEWLAQFPIWRKMGNGAAAVTLRRDLLAYRTLLDSKALSNFNHHAARAVNFKDGGDTPLTRTVMALVHLPAPADWKICGQCKGATCSDCGYSGYALHSGIEVK